MSMYQITHYQLDYFFFLTVGTMGEESINLELGLMVHNGNFAKDFLNCPMPEALTMIRQKCVKTHSQMCIYYINALCTHFCSDNDYNTLDRFLTLNDDAFLPVNG